MRSLLALAIFTVVIPGCGTTRYEGHTSVNPKLRPLVSDWIATCKKHLPADRCDLKGIRSIRLEKELDHKDVIGTCLIGVVYGEEIRDVFIKEGIDLTTYYAKAIMLHEMMHCRLGFERHENTGVMNEYAIYSEETLKENWEELVTETYSLVK